MNARLMDVYSIMCIPMNIHTGTNSVTYFDSLSPYIALDSTGQYFSLLNTQDMAQCDGGRVLKCKSQPTMRSTTSPSCEVALMQDNADLVEKWCNIKIVMNSNKTVVNTIKIDSNRYFITANDLQWWTTCQINKPIPFPGCSFCTVSIPCGCSLSSTEFLIPMSIQGCNKSESFSQLHSLNLPLLRKIINSNKIKVISGSQFHSEPVNGSFPELQVYSRNLESVLNSDDELSASFAAVSSAIASNSTIFPNLLTYVFDKLQFMFSPLITLSICSLPAIYVALAIVCVRLVYCVVRINQLRIAILVLAASESVAAIELFDPTTTVTTPQPSPELAQELGWNVKENIVPALTIIAVYFPKPIVLSSHFCSYISDECASGWSFAREDLLVLQYQ